MNAFFKGFQFYHYYLTTILICFYGVSACSAQSPAIVWSKTYGSTLGASGFDIQPTPDGNFIVLAATAGSDLDIMCNNHGGNDIWVYKIDHQGNIIWQQCYGGSGEESNSNVSRILNTNDGYIFICKTFSFDGDVTGNHGDDVWIVRINAAGNIIWQRCYGGGGSEFPMGIASTNDGGFIFTALSNTVGPDGDIPFHYGTFLTYDAWVVKINADGNIIWNTVFGGSDTDLLCSVAETSNGDFVLFGYTSSTDGDLIGLDIDETDGWILKIDSGGNILWSRNYGANDSEGFTGGIVTSTNELLAYGDASDIPVDIGFHHGQGDKWVVKTNDQGEILWQGLYGGSNPEGLTYDIIKESTFNDGYYIGSVSKSSDWDVGNHHGSPNEWDYWIFKLDHTGQIIWSVALGGSKGDNLYGLSISNAIYLIGRTESSDGDVVNLTDTTSVWILNLSDYNNIENFSLSPHIYIYPNPLHDRATLEFSKIIGNVLLKISSVDGKFVQQFEINSRRTILKIDAPPGIYIYTIQDRNNIVINSGDLIIY